jgi:hypothetical protein
LERTTYTHDANDRPTGRQYPNGTRATFVYGSVSNRITMQDNTGAHTTTFDALDRKQTVTNPADRTATYADLKNRFLTPLFVPLFVM